jgi:hypothetical protein
MQRGIETWHSVHGRPRPSGSVRDPGHHSYAWPTVSRIWPPMYVVDGVVLGVGPTARSITRRAALVAGISCSGHRPISSEGRAGAAAFGPGVRGVDLIDTARSSVARARRESVTDLRRLPFTAPLGAYLDQAQTLLADLHAGDDATAWRFKWEHPRFRDAQVGEVRSARSTSRTRSS